MALAKVYDSEDTLMVPLDLESSGQLLDELDSAIAHLENEGHFLTSRALREIGDAIGDARTAAGLDT